MNAYEFMQWLRASDSDTVTGIDTPYSRQKITEYGMMHVNATKLFSELTHEQKLELSNKHDKVYALTIWSFTWVCIPQLPESWFLVATTNWHPSVVSVNGGQYLISVEDKFRIYIPV